MPILKKFSKERQRIEGLINVAFDDGAGRVHSQVVTLAEYKREQRNCSADAVTLFLVFSNLNPKVADAMKNIGAAFLQESIKGYGVVRRYKVSDPDCEGIGTLQSEVVLRRGHYYPFYEVTEQAYKKMLKGNFGQPELLSNKLRKNVILPLRRLICGF